MNCFEMVLIWECLATGFSLFLVLIIDRIHNYIRELHRLRTNLEARSEART